MGPPSPLACPLKFKGGQRGARAKFGDFLDFPVRKAVMRGDACGSIMARSGETADIKRPYRSLLQYLQGKHALRSRINDNSAVEVPSMSSEPSGYRVLVLGMMTKCSSDHPQFLSQLSSILTLV